MSTPDVSSFTTTAGDRARTRTRLPNALIVPLSIVLMAAGCADRPVGQGPSAGTDASAGPHSPSATKPDKTSSGDHSSGKPAPQAGYPVSVGTPGGNELTLQSRPERIVSLSPSATEMLAAVGAADQLVAVDEQSNYPKSVPTTQLSGFQPNVEAIADYRPDLVVASGDRNSLVDGLDALDIPVLLTPAATRFQDSYRELQALGTATGHAAEGRSVASTMRSRLQETFASAPEPTRPRSVYHELDPSYYSASSQSFIGQVYAKFGLDNIADGQGTVADYPQLSAEHIVQSDPDLIVVTDPAAATQIPNRPGWQQIDAVTDEAIVVANPDIASRWGPRIVEFAKRIARELRQLQ